MLVYSCLVIILCCSLAFSICTVNCCYWWLIDLIVWNLMSLWRLANSMHFTFFLKSYLVKLCRDREGACCFWWFTCRGNFTVGMLIWSFNIFLPWQLYKWVSSERCVFTILEKKLTVNAHKVEFINKKKETTLVLLLIYFIVFFSDDFDRHKYSHSNNDKYVNCSLS